MFNRRKKEEKAEEDKFSRLKEFRDVGETFQYLGRTCVVTGFMNYPMALCDLPTIMYDYADNNGVIHSALASIHKLEAIIAQQHDEQEIKPD